MAMRMRKERRFLPRRERRGLRARQLMRRFVDRPPPSDLTTWRSAPRRRSGPTAEDTVHAARALLQSRDPHDKAMAEELALGLVHFTDGIEGTRRRMDAARPFVTNYAVATECGFGRRAPETIPELLRLHLAAADYD